MLGFEYRQWAGWGVGSSITMLEETIGWEMRITLKSLDGDQADLTVASVGDHARRSRGMSFTMTLPSGVERPAASSKRKKKRTPVEKIVRPQRAVVATPLLRVSEGSEVVDVAGEEMVCRWIERQGTRYDQEYRIKTWMSERVPGGIVRMESRLPQLGGAPSIWKLTSFDRK